MDSNIFCVLCGNPFELEHHIYNIDPQKEAYQWIYDARLLGNLLGFSNHSLVRASDSYVDKIDNAYILLSETIRWTATDYDLFLLNDLYYQVLTEDEYGNVVFPLHYACVQIGCRVLEEWPMMGFDFSRVPTIDRLYWVLHRRFHHQKYSAGLIGYDILDLSSESETYGPRSVLAMDELGWWGDAHVSFLTNPVKIPDLTCFIVRALDSSPPRRDQVMQITKDPIKNRPLEALPVELLDRVTDFLPPQSVINLRRTSKVLVLKVPLDDRFWRKRLLDGSLLPHIWDVEKSKLRPLKKDGRKHGLCIEDRWDYSSVVKLLKTREFPVCRQDLRLDDLPLGLWNRCRIWNVIEELCAQ